MSVSRVILYPAKWWFIAFTLLLALSLNLLPADSTWLRAAPDWLLMVLLYWVLNQPRRVGFLLAFASGLAMDVAHGQLLGQHALAYVLCVYLILFFQRRLLMLQVWQQALHLVGFLLLARLLIAVFRLLPGADWPGSLWFLSPLLGGLLWMPLVYICQWPQRRAPLRRL